MNVAGIIAEYNPFHKGHQYQIQTLRQQTNTDYVIVIMSGNFLQRGVPALTDKYTRAKMALLQGADLVLELPVLFSTASAELFAFGGVSLLNTTGVANTLCFGAETQNLDKLCHIAHILNKESQEYTSNLQKYLKQGDSYPAARAKAVGIHEDILNLPNNILGIEYLKAILATNSSLRPYLITRQGSGYHDTSFDNPFASATAIRRSLFEKDSVSQLTSFLPEHSYHLLNDYKKRNHFLTEDHFSLLLKYKLLQETQEHLSTYGDSSISLANRITKQLHDFIDWRQFCTLLKTKEVTYTRISRLLTHILLNITASDYEDYRNKKTLPYIRILGFRKEAQPLLTEMKKRSCSPMITKLSSATQHLSPEGLASIKKDIFAADVYQSVLTEKTLLKQPNEFNRKMMII